MSTRPSESLKSIANQLAHLVAAGDTDAVKIRKLEEKLGHMNPVTVPIKAPSPAPVPLSEGREKMVGIWKCTPIDGEKHYIRDLSRTGEFEAWARVQQIPPKRSNTRVILLGESAARGTLLDPYFTPAAALEMYLNAVPSVMDAEVVDLARVDCSIHYLKQLYSDCFEMEPDAVVIFAGNNWLNAFGFSRTELEEMVRIMATGERFDGLKQRLEERYKDMISDFMKHIDSLSREKQVPVIFIIPEFNLRDWKSNPTEQINSWPAGETAKWLELKGQVEEALADEDWDRAEILAAQLIELNKGTPLGYEFTATCKLKKQAFPDAIRYLRAAVDTAIFRLINVPCCISVVREALREEAGKYKIPTVDLAELYAAQLSGKPPGREFFYDYCHLTVEGIKVAMADAARVLFQVLKKSTVSPAQLAAAFREPDPVVVSRAHFFAAIHNAHRGELPYEILYHHCLKALETSPDTKKIMLEFLDMAVRHTPWSLCKSCSDLFESGQLNQYALLIQPHKHYIMDIELVEAMLDALQTVNIDVRDQVRRLRKKEHGFINGKIDLLESYYHLASYAATFRPNDSYYRAFSTQSVFFLPIGKEKDVSLRITCRLPRQNTGKETLKVKIDGTVVSELSVSDKWRDFSIKLPEELLTPDITRLVLQWPAANFNESPGDPQSQYTGLKAVKSLIYPEYGEIFSFKCVRAPGAAREISGEEKINRIEEIDSGKTTELMQVESKIKQSDLEF